MNTFAFAVWSWLLPSGTDISETHENCTRSHLCIARRFLPTRSLFLPSFLWFLERSRIIKNLPLTYQLVSCYFEPSQPQRITPGLNTNFILSPSYSFHKSLHHKSYVFWAYLCSAGTQHRNLHPARWLILFRRPTQEPVLATANTGKTWEKFWKKCR